MKRLCGKLALLPYFPAGDDVVADLSEFVEEFATDDAQVDWLGKRMLALYREWPGTMELRACFCAKFKPATGKTTFSTVYPDGIPSEKPEPPPLLALPPGVEASKDPLIETSMRALAANKDLNRVGRRRVVPGIPVVEVPPERRITQADVDREKERQRDEKARRELEGGDAEPTAT